MIGDSICFVKKNRGERGDGSSVHLRVNRGTVPLFFPVHTSCELPGNETAEPPPMFHPFLIPVV